jgi:hypothetical protein
LHRLTNFIHVDFCQLSVFFSCHLLTAAHESLYPAFSVGFCSITK